MHERNMFLFLAVGSAAALYAACHIQKERRSFHNAIAAALACVCFIRAGMEYWMHRDPGILLSGSNKNQWILTKAGEAQGKVFQIFLLMIFLCGLLMIANGIHLIRREGCSIAHALPAFLGIMCVYYAAAPLIQGFLLDEKNAGYFDLFAAATEFSKKCALFVLFMIFAYVTYSVWYQMGRQKREPDFIVIHGAKVFGRKVSLLLAKRIDKAVELFRTYGERPVLIVSGGKGPDEICTEAEAMETYLLEKGIPKDHIIKEDRSLSTKQNLVFSKEIMDERKPGSYCIFTTNDYHVLRASVLAAKEGVNGDGAGCRTALYYLPAAAIREAAAFIVMYKKLALVMIVFSMTELLATRIFA